MARKNVQPDELQEENKAAVEEAAADASDEAAEEGAEESKASSKKASFPEVAGNGKFQAVEVKGGFVVYNPSGQRVTGVVSSDEAHDSVARMNTAGSLK